jgi:transcriptional regulator with XRE-family HTH domain
MPRKLKSTKLTNRQIGAIIRALREEAQMTQLELSQRCGWPHEGRVSHYETGRSIISYADLVSICETLADPEDAYRRVREALLAPVKSKPLRDLSYSPRTLTITSKRTCKRKKEKANAK